MDLNLQLSKRKITRILIAVVVFLHLANLLAIWIRFTPLSFPLDDTYVALLGVSSEGKIPTWYSAVSLLFCSVLLAFISKAKYQERDPFRKQWLILSILFAILSLDEATSIHEMATGPIRAALDTKGVFYYAWVIPGIAFVIAFGVLYIRFLLHLETRTKRLFIVAGLVYVAGVLGMELVGSWYTSQYGWSLTYGFIAALEELLEMLGIVVFIYAILDVIEMSLISIRITLPR